jgi:ribose transport system substrate-binding protein
MRYRARANFLYTGLVVLLALAAAGRTSNCILAQDKASKPFANYKTGLPPKDKRSAPAKGETKRIIMLINGTDPYWDAMKAGMEDAAKEFKLSDAGFKVEMDKNDGTPKGQIDKLTQYINQTDIAAVAVCATEAKNTQISNALRKLQKQGVVVITVDSDVDRDTARDARFAYLGTDNFIGGRQLGKAAAGLRASGGKYAEFVGLKTAANAIERSNGFKEGAGSKFERIEYLGDEFDLSTAQKNVRDTLDRHADIDTLVGIYAYNADPIAQTVKQRGIRDKMKVVVFDASPLGLRDMADGLVDAMVVQSPYQMGYDGVRLMKAAVEDDQAMITKLLPKWDSAKQEFTAPGGDIITTELRVVVPDDKSPLKQEMFDSGTKFFTFPEFKNWLNSKKLTGS